MLYTTYFGNMKNIPEGMAKIAICRNPPKFVFTDNSLYWVKDLSPRVRTLKRYKAGKLTWPQFKARFIKQVKTYFPTNIQLKALLNDLRKGNDVCLICYEKDYKHCHRYLIAKFLIHKGIRWKEL